MNKFTLRLLIIFFCFNNFVLNSYGRSKRARIDRFDGICEGGKRADAILFQNGRITVVGQQFLVDYVLDVQRDLINPMKFDIHIQRCRSRESLDSCEKFFDFHLKDYCLLLKNKLWGQFLLNLKPNFTCPPKKGAYRSTNTTLNGQAFLLFTPDNYYWKVRAFMVDVVTNEILLCVNVEAWTYFQ